MLSTEELSCYRRTLDENREFHQLIENRDKVLRSCVQRYILNQNFSEMVPNILINILNNGYRSKRSYFLHRMFASHLLRFSVRLHSGCRKADKSRVRPCVCNARDELENRLLTEVSVLWIHEINFLHFLDHGLHAFEQHCQGIHSHN